MTRDPHRLYSAEDRRIVRDNQDGNCAGTCGATLPDDFHMHHRVGWSQGGPTIIGNARGLCPSCHLTAPNERFDDLAPRDWQIGALAETLPRLRQRWTATVMAAPGAGKTLFTGFTIQALFESGTIERVVVFVPNNVLKGQWARDLKRLGIHIDDAAGRHVVENPDSGFVGVVHTYQILTQGALTTNALIARAERSRTLYVFDEVHHLAEAEHSAWGQAVGALIGSDPDHPRHPVLNLSGTLFRSAPGQKIGTVRYEGVVGSNKVQAIADYAVYTNELIATEQLRHVSLWQFDSTLEIVDLHEETVTTSGIIDLSEQEPPVRTVALRAALRDDNYLRPLLMDMKGKLFEQHNLLDGHPVKALVVCDTQDHARQVHDLLSDIMGRRPFLAVSDDGPQALRAIREFRETNKMAALVTVRMVTEGFDCPDIATLVHLTPWRAPLFINQMVARAMRISDSERRLRTIIPAAVLIPRDTQIRDVYNRVLVQTMHILELPKVCPTCGQAPCICRAGDGGGGAGPGTDVLVHVLDAAELAGLSHDGDEIDMATFDPFSELLAARGVPHVYHPAFAAVYAEATTRTADPPRSSATSRGATLREQMFGHLELIDRCAAWWVHNGGSEVAEFQSEVNRQMGVANGDRHWATLEQLSRGIAFARSRVVARCEHLGAAVPAWARGGE